MHPGAVLPGVVGAICLILSFYGLSVLPVDYAGLALILLAVVFFILEIKVTSYGMLGVAGTLSLVLGSLMLFKTSESALRVSVELIAMVAAFSLLVVGFLVFMALRARRAAGALRDRGADPRDRHRPLASRPARQGLRPGRDLGRRSPTSRSPRESRSRWWRSAISPWRCAAARIPSLDDSIETILLR